jgi:peptide/nickel transport system permease protein
VAWGRYLTVRVALALVTLFLISIVTFTITDVVPSDPARVALGKSASEEELASYRQQQGLNEPVLQRYGDWLGGAVHGDWGTSVITRRSVSELIGPKLLRSLIVGTAAMLLAVPLAFLLGVFAGRRGGRPSDHALSGAALVLNSLPEFVVGLAVLVVFAVWLQWLPVESSAASFGTGWDKVKAYILPVLSLALLLTPYMLRMVRVNVRDTIAQPYVRSAVLRGVPRSRVIWRHVVPNASLPVISVVALSLAELIGGVVVIETVFGFPGIGKQLVDSVDGKDIPVVQAIALVMGAGYVFLNLAADALLILLNPRLRTR